ncbi:periplasmic copper chaperone A [Janthinobacterium sp. CG_23.3]|uniref:copper chaperone PCu(A)C n=1 Tax=unclassified Janthinobacterium TaxID=2610881 RepID=UPI00034659A4|nr:MULTISPECIES: copper chaperone PCu(A)C [unclassified Janthinobacterium]MEC5164226.1 copper(I)-binding protein [Janthinobacterium sp. CG_S6]
MNKQFIAFLTTMTLASCALAQVSVTAPWIRATVPQGKATGAFMQIKSDQDVRLVEVRTSVAGIAEIHQMEMLGQTMKMHAVDGLDLAAGKTLHLGPGGYHIMLMELKRQLKQGETVALTLVVQGKDKKRKNIELAVPVKALTYVDPAGPAAMPAMAPQHQH